MVNIGIICEYNPFHNGHLYHINEIKKRFKDSRVIALISGNFTQRGIPSVIEKYDKAKIAIENNIDLVIELPFVFASQSADIFAKGAIEILSELKIDYLVFGSESDNVENLKLIASNQINNKEFDIKVKQYMSEGMNYPTAMSKASNAKLDLLNSPNDLLGISYIKEIIKQNSNITPLTIKRTNDYHSKDYNSNSNIISASAIREAYKNNIDIEKYVPENVQYKINKVDYFNLLKYKIITEGKNINKYQTVDEGIENRILKVINNCNNIDELIQSVKTKRYTYNKLSRMFIHILCSFTKEEAFNNKSIKYIRVLDFNPIGQKYLNKVKKELNVPLITTTKYYNNLLEIDNRVDKIYELIRL